MNEDNLLEMGKPVNVESLTFCLYGQEDKENQNLGLGNRSSIFKFKV